MLTALLAAAVLSAPAAATAQAACPLPAAEAAAVRALVARQDYDGAIQRLYVRQKTRRGEGAPRTELACLDGAMGDVEVARGALVSAGASYQQGIEALGGRIPPEQRDPPADPEDDEDPAAVTAMLAVERAGGLAKLDEPVMDSLTERLVETFLLNRRALEADGLAQPLLARRRARLGPDSGPALASLAAVVEMERLLNRWEAAVPASADHLARLNRLRGPGGAETLAAGVKHAAILTGAGQEVEAARLARRLEAQAATALGAAHATTFAARLVAAQAEVSQARPPALAELETLAREARAALGPDHPTALDSETLAIAGLLREGRYGEAQTRADVHYVRLAKARGALDSDWVIVDGMRAEAALRQGRFDLSGPMYSQVAVALRERLTPQHPLSFGATIGWGRSLLGPADAPARDLEIAEQLFDQARDGYGTLGLTGQRDEALGWRGQARLRLDRPQAAYGDLTAASSAIWRRQADPSRIASTEAAGELLRENRQLFMLTVKAGWRWAHQP